MTSRERVFAAVAHEPVDQTPVIVYPEDEFYSDVAIVSTQRLANAKSSPRVVLSEVLSPLARAIDDGVDLNNILHEDPAQGAVVLNGYVAQAKLEIRLAKASVADGIFYHLKGAEPKYSTPMQYGGHYLEADRELLTFAADMRLNVLLIDGGPEVFMDFVSDLPAAVFAWHGVTTGIPLGAVRKMRAGALATTDPDAELLFGRNYGLLQQFVHRTVAESNV